MRTRKLGVCIAAPLRGIGRRLSAPLVLSLLALFVALGGVGNAATGAKFALGKLNGANRTTSLSSTTRSGPSLAITNRSGKPAASFTVTRGAPFIVSSGAKVARLNADLLDGRDSAAFQLRVTGVCPAGSAIRTVAADGSVECQGTTGTGGSPAPPAWALNGNTGTSATSFIGTRDDRSFIVKTNDKEALRVTSAGDVGVGIPTPTARLEASGPGIGLLGTSPSRGVVGRLGSISCPGAPYAVGGCAGANGTGVLGSSVAGVGVAGTSTSGRAVQGFSGNGIGVTGDSSTRGVVGTLGGSPCAGTFAVGGCGGTVGDGVRGVSSVGPNTITAAAVHGINTAGGDIFIGEAAGARKARIDGNGRGFFNGGTQASGADYADSMRAHGAARLEPGDVLAIDAQHGNAVRKSSNPNSRLVAGVYSTKPAALGVGAHRIGDSLRGEVPVALVGIVPTKVTTENGSIRPGDLLTTSSTPGFAMKASAVLVRGIPTYRTGTILGKALEPLRHGNGVISVLVMLR